MPATLAGLAHLLSAALATATLTAPIDWSRDGRWIAYATVESSDSPALPSGWLTSRPTAVAEDVKAAGPARKTYRIWATRPAGHESVLIEESQHPLSSPAWSGDGRTLAFVRFVVEGADGPASGRGRLEAVVQTGLDQKRVVTIQPDLELDAEPRSAMVRSRPALSPDGRRLAVARPGTAGGLWLVDLAEERGVRSVDKAVEPAWSPDGRRLAFLRSTPSPAGDPLVSVHVLSAAVGGERLVASDPAFTPSFLAWGSDGHSLAMIACPMRGALRNTQLDLARIPLDPGGGVARMSTLESTAPVNAVRRTRDPAMVANAAKPPSIRIDLSLDQEQEQGVGLVESDDEQVFKWWNLRSSSPLKRFHPLDASMRIGPPAISPDGRTVAFRIDDGSGAGLAALIDLATEEVTPLAPDQTNRIRWLDRLAASASGLLAAWLPAPGEGLGVRATILPVAGELGGMHPKPFRLKRIAKFAAPLLGPAPDGPAGDGLEESRLFFSYLNQDYEAAGRCLDAVEASTDDPDMLLRWLCLRSQILLGQGEGSRARGVIAYLHRETSPTVQAVEETAAGFRLAPQPDPRRAWADHLLARSSDEAVQRARNGVGDFQAAFRGGEVEANDVGDLDRVPNLPFAPNPGLGPGLVPPAPGEFIVPPRPARARRLFPLGPGADPEIKDLPPIGPPPLRLEVEE